MTNIYKNLLGNNSKISANEIAFIKNNIGVPLEKTIVVESHGNSSGNYFKLGNGWMVCAMEVSVIQDINIKFGNDYISNGITFPDYPVTFISKPIISCTIEGTGAANLYYISGGIGTATKPSSIFPCCAQEKTNINIIANIIAFGRWK